MNKLPVILHCVLIGCVLFVTVSVFRLSASLHRVNLYRDEVRQLSVEFYQYMTNLEYQVYCYSSSVSTSDPVLSEQSSTQSSSEYQKSLGSLPYSFCVVRGKPGLRVDSSHWYPIGSYTAYGVLTNCGPDFAIFDDVMHYVLKRSADERCPVL